VAYLATIRSTLTPGEVAHISFGDELQCSEGAYLESLASSGILHEFRSLPLSEVVTLAKQKLEVTVKAGLRLGLVLTQGRGSGAEDRLVTLVGKADAASAAIDHQVPVIDNTNEEAIRAAELEAADSAGASVVQAAMRGRVSRRSVNDQVEEAAELQRKETRTLTLTITITLTLIKTPKERGRAQTRSGRACSCSTVGK